MASAGKPQLTLDAAPVEKRLLGECAALHQVREGVVRAAPLAVPVLVEGDTGTGKEIVSQLLHEHSGRRGRFVPVNVADLRQDMAEAELFGTVRGAFTDATERAGRFEDADGGTLLLDEAADLPRSLQARLLRVLETGLFSRVGETRERKASCRLVITVQVSPSRLLLDGRWRPDFLYRVGRLHFTLPALAARGTDLLLLANGFLAAAGEPPLEVHAQEELSAYHWPGNVRELAHAVERAVFVANGRSVSAGDIVAAARLLMPGAPEVKRGDALALRSPRWDQDRGSRTHVVRLAERAHIEEVLRNHGFHVRAAAVALGISRTHLYRRLRELGIALPLSDGSGAPSAVS